MLWFFAQAVAVYVGAVIGFLVCDDKAMGDVFRFFAWLRRLRS